MTATKTAAPSVYVSGHCTSAGHERCRGEYSGVTCTCSCHTEPPTVAEPEAVLPLLLARHCPSCSCEGHG